jgi:hypothetical protein
MSRKPWLYSHIKEPSLADCGVGMTVCIAVSCEKNSANPRIVMVSDTLVTMGITSADALKGRWLADTWSVLMAGDDVTYAEDVISEAAIQLGLKPTNSLADAAAAMTHAYQTIRRKQIEDSYLSAYGLDMAGFLAQSADYPTPTKRQSILDEIDKFNLGCEFVVAGFSPTTAVPYIFQVCNPGKYIPQSLLGYWAIGSGEVNAITYLARRNQHANDALESTLYNAIAAKKLAEKAAGVGKTTVAYIMEFGKTEVRWVKPQEIEDISIMWESEESYVRPTNLRDRMKTILNPPQQSALPAMPSVSEKSEPKP